jgi:hypothetical protein
MLTISAIPVLFDDYRLKFTDLVTGTTLDTLPFVYGLRFLFLTADSLRGTTFTA